MLPMTSTKTAADFAADLMRDAADFCADRIDYETLHERNSETWRAVVACGIEMYDDVAAVLRDAPPEAR